MEETPSSAPSTDWGEGIKARGSEKKRLGKGASREIRFWLSSWRICLPAADLRRCNGGVEYQSRKSNEYAEKEREREREREQSRRIRAERIVEILPDGWDAMHCLCLFVAVRHRSARTSDRIYIRVRLWCSAPTDHERNARDHEWRTISRKYEFRCLRNFMFRGLAAPDRIPSSNFSRDSLDFLPPQGES